jgi:hypothetical protein
MRRTQTIYSRGYLGGIVFAILAFCLYFCAILPNSSSKTPLAFQSRILGAFENLASIQAKPVYSTEIGVATKPPQGLLDIYGWGSYFIFQGIVLAIPVVIGFLLWNFMCWYCSCRLCCGNCGGRPKIGGYTKRDRYIMAIPYLIILIFLTIVGVLGCVFSLLFVGGMKIVTKEGYTLFDNMLGRVDQVQDTMDNVFSAVNNIFIAVKTAISGLFGFVPILNDIDNDLQATTTELNIMTDHLNYMSTNVTLITEKTLGLNEIGALQGYAPTIDDIPNPLGNLDVLQPFKETATEFSGKLQNTKSTGKFFRVSDGF